MIQTVLSPATSSQCIMNQPLVDQKQCQERQVTTARKSLEIPGMDRVRNIWQVAILRDPQRTTKHIVSLAKTTYRWCHRNPIVAALSAISAATLLIGMAVFMHVWVQRKSWKRVKRIAEM